MEKASYLVPKPLTLYTPERMPPREPIEVEEMEPRVSIIVLNWNGWRDTIECIESLYQIEYNNFDIIIVDNGSKDESIEKIRAYCKGNFEVKSRFFEYNQRNKPIKIIEYTREEADAGGGREREHANLHSDRMLAIIKNRENYGFAEGNNIAIRYTLGALNPEYILLLNNDTVVDRGFLGALLEVAEIDEKIGIVGPKVYYYDYDGRTDVINFAGGKLNMWKGQSFHIGINEIDIGQYDEIKQVDYIEGSALLVKKDVLNKIGLIDSSYFAYWEENDICMRAYKAGYNSIYVPSAKMRHKISSSASGSLKKYYLTRNRFRFMKKHATKLQLISFLLYYFGYEFWLTLGVSLVYHRDVAGSVSFFKSIVDGLTDSEISK